MKKRIVQQVALGFVIGVVATVIGSVIYMELFSNFSFFSDFQILLKSGNLGKVMAIGGILNLIVFSILIRKQYDYVARGCVLAVIVLTLLTFIA